MIKEIKKDDIKKVDEFIAIDGNWDKVDGIIRYTGPIVDEKFTGTFGLVKFQHTLINGAIKAKIKSSKKCYARLVFGYDAKTKEYYSVGIGSNQYLYILEKFEDGTGWKPLEYIAYKQEIHEDKTYDVEVKIEGQRVILKVNNITIFDYQLPEPLRGKQTGLFAWGNGKVEFSDVTIIGAEAKAKAFVIMEFSEPYKSLYEEVIVNICEEMELYVYKADEVYTPGFILNDIIGGIIESEVIIADITPVNANVFYELGYAHAFFKPTILLAQRGTQLPFDLSGYRVIFYDDSIKGKREVEEKLRKHLKSIIK